MKDDIAPSDKPKRTTNGDGLISGFGPWLNGNRAFESWTQSDAKMMGRAATELSQELMAFWQSRFQADMEGWKAFASCHNPASSSSVRDSSQKRLRLSIATERARSHPGLLAS